jgi:aspartyl aminopeptidase
MKEPRFAKEFFNFLASSPTPYHAISSMAANFRKQGYLQLFEQNSWNLIAGNAYFVVRDDGALIAFRLHSEPSNEGFRILGAHSDSPCLQIKPLPDIKTLNYHQLGVEIYGGALLNPWFDRDLSLAGRACCRMKDNSLKVFLVDFHRPLLSIPSLAIHLDRDVNKNRSLNAQQHLTPILSQVANDLLPDFKTILKQQIANEKKEKDIIEVLGFDMFCYDPQAPGHIGLKNEFISAGRLDNLLSCFVGMVSMLEAKESDNCMFICNNHEEIGSTSMAGALGSLPATIFERIVPDLPARRICLSKSFFISMDNAHAVHPNYTDKSDPAHQILLNHGPVIKINANQRYASNSFSKSLFRLLAKEIEIETQEFVMRNDMACGSTIGPLISSQLGIRTVDVGAPTLAMHSIREITGSKDPFLLYRTILHFLTRDNLPGETC